MHLASFRKKKDELIIHETGSNWMLQSAENCKIQHHCCFHFTCMCSCMLYVRV